MNTNTHSEQLEQTRQAFAQHRARHRPRQRIPEPLRQQALALLQHYSQRHVCKSLNLTADMLRIWQQQHTPDTSPTPATEHRFVTLPAETALTNESIGKHPGEHQALHLHLTLPTGVKLTLQGQTQALSHYSTSLLLALNYHSSAHP